MSNDGPQRTPGRWWRRGLAVAAVLAMVVSAYALLFGAGSPRDSNSRLTYEVKRGDLIVTVTGKGLLESAGNDEIKCKVRGHSTVTWVVDSGTYVEPGDELVRLDTLLIEETLAERTKYAHWSRSSAERSRANVARAELAISEYEQGRYAAELMRLEKDLAVAESNLRTAQDMLDYTGRLVERDYQTKLAVEERELAVTRAELNLEVKATEIDVLKRFTKAMELETLKGDLKAAKADLAAAEERAVMDATRRDLAREELEYCVVKAERSGMVIHPSAARWENAPKIEEGTTVHKDQVLLLMPDLTKMQVKLGIHESRVDRIKPRLAARVTLPDKTLDGEVSSVASVAAPASWWTGNEVKYETIIKLPSAEGLMPGMSADVEIIIDRHGNVLTIPVAAVVETAGGNFCWVETADGMDRRLLHLGDTNDVFTIVESGLKEGDKVILNPPAFTDKAHVTNANLQSDR